MMPSAPYSGDDGGGVAGTRARSGNERPHQEERRAEMVTMTLAARYTRYLLTSLATAIFGMQMQ